MKKLYITSTCPYCKKVLTAAEKIGLKEGKDFTVIDASSGTPGREVVLQVGGKAMVPFLIDGDVSMYESDDIIAYLNNLSSD